MKLFDKNCNWLSDSEKAELAALGWEVVEPQERLGACPVSETEIDAVLIDGRFPIDDIEKFTNLKMVVLTSAGFDGVQTDYLKAHGIRLYNARGVFSAPIAEFVMLGALQLYKKSAKFVRQAHERMWKRDFNLGELVGKIVCIVGTGSIGDACAKRFEAMECRVIGVSRSGNAEWKYDEMFILSDIDKALSVSDIVVLSLPLNDESRHLFNAERFAAMKKGAVLINIARGPIVCENDLIAAVKSGQLGGAALDVFETEPLSPDSELWEMENVIMTPHNSFSGDGVRARLGERVMSILKSGGEGIAEAI